MREWDISYVRHTDELPDGFRRTKGLQGTIHAEFAELAVSGPLCPFCGHPLCEPVNTPTHVEGSICKQVKESCCGDR